MEMVHTPVMVAELLDLLAVKQEGIYCDATLGNAGHAVEILKKLGPEGFFLGLDQDSEILEVAQGHLAPWKKQVSVYQVNFADIGVFLKGQNMDTPSNVIPAKAGIQDLSKALDPRFRGDDKSRGFDGIYADLGVSSLQLDRAERGFSFKNEGPLDMRMNPDAGMPVLEKLKESNVNELTHVLKELGEEGLAPKIARKIMEALQMGELQNTWDLAELVSAIYPPFARHGRIHPATRTFQALRIWINDELGNLKTFLREAPLCLKEGGRLCVMSYHSLEDRLVKHTFRSLAEEDKFEVLTKRPVTPSDAEIAKNPRSRSAKLRGLLRKEI